MKRPDGEPIGDVINYRAIEAQQMTKSLRSTLSTFSSTASKLSDGSYDRNSWKATTKRRDYAYPCNCALCVAVAKRQFFTLSNTNGFDEYKVCHRTDRLNDASRLQEINCWKCRNHCWHNYSISHAWLKKKKSLPVYKRRPHQQIAKLPQIYEPQLETEGISSSNLQSQRSGMRQDYSALSSESCSGLMEGNSDLKLPPIKSRRQGLAVNMLPRAVVSEVFGVVPNTDFHYNEKTEAQMRWLLIKASLKRLIAMDQRKKLDVKGSFSTLISNMKLMEQKKAEELKRQQQLAIERKEMLTKQSVVRKIKLTKVKNSIENALKAERERKVKEMQLKMARQKLLNHKIGLFRESIEVYQRKISKFLFPRTSILIDTKRLKLRKHLFTPKSRPKLHRSQSELNVRDPLVDRLWMEPQVDDFLSSVDWLNELIMNKMRTDFIERISNAFLLPMKISRCKSVPCVNMEDVCFKFHLGQRKIFKKCETFSDLSEPNHMNQNSENLSLSMGRGIEKLGKQGFEAEETFMEFLTVKEKFDTRQATTGTIEFESWVIPSQKEGKKTSAEQNQSSQKTKAYSADKTEASELKKSDPQTWRSTKPRFNSAPLSRNSLSTSSFSSIRPLKTVVFDLNKLAVRSFTAYRSMGSQDIPIEKPLELNIHKPSEPRHDESVVINSSKTVLDPIGVVKNNSAVKLEQSAPAIGSDGVGDNSRGKKNIRRLSKIALLGKDRTADDKSKPNLGRRKTLAKISTDMVEKPPIARPSKLAAIGGSKAIKGATSWKKLKSVVKVNNKTLGDKQKNDKSELTSQREQKNQGAEIVESVVIGPVDEIVEQTSTENVKLAEIKNDVVDEALNLISNEVINEDSNDVTNEVSKDVTNGVSNDVTYEISNDVTNEVSNDAMNDQINDVSAGSKTSMPSSLSSMDANLAK